MFKLSSLLILVIVFFSILSIQKVNPTDSTPIPNSTTSTIMTTTENTTLAITTNNQSTIPTVLNKATVSSNYFSVILTNTSNSDAYYQNENIFLNGTVYVDNFIALFNCSVYYSSITGNSGFLLKDGANMFVKSSKFSPIGYNDLFNIRGTKDNLLSIIDSTLIGKSESYSSIIQLTNSADIYISNSNFFNVGNFASINNSKNVIFDSNNITNFKVALIFNGNSSNVLITKNNFVNGLTAIVFDHFNFSDNFNCYFNDFEFSQTVLYIQNFTRSQFIDGPISYNHYSMDKGIDFNNDGFNDQPYSTPFFIDHHPLSYPYKNYYIVNNQVALQTNYNENSLFHNSSNFSHFGSDWYFLFLFYAIITILPVVILFKMKRRKLKV